MKQRCIKGKKFTWMDIVLFTARFTTVHHHSRHKGQKNQHCAKSLASGFTVLVLTLLPAIAMSAPTPTQEPHWINPCDLPDPFEDFNNPPPIPPQELLKQVIQTSNIAKKHARDVKDEFVREKFQDATFDVDYMRQEWLPEVPRATFEHFKSMNVSEAYKKSYEYMQFYAVGIEEMKFDQILYPESEGNFKDEFQNLQNHARPVLCRLHLGIIVMKIKQNPDVMRKVMEEEYRDIEQESKRNLRDFLILRDYVETITYIWELFTYLLENRPT